MLKIKKNLIIASILLLVLIGIITIILKIQVEKPLMPTVIKDSEEIRKALNASQGAFATSHEDWI